MPNRARHAAERLLHTGHNWLTAVWTHCLSRSNGVLVIRNRLPPLVLQTTPHTEPDYGLSTVCSIVWCAVRGCSIKQLAPHAKASTGPQCEQRRQGAHRLAGGAAGCNGLWRRGARPGKQARWLCCILDVNLAGTCHWQPLRLHCLRKRPWCALHGCHVVSGKLCGILIERLMRSRCLQQD